MHKAVPAKFRLASIQKPLFAVTVALVPLWVIGQAARDRSWLTGLCFYIPSAFLAGLLLCSTLLQIWRRRWRPAALVACLAIAPTVVALMVENHLFADRSATIPGQLRLVHWNVGGSLLKPGARDVLHALRANLYVLSEVPNTESVEALRDGLGADYESQVIGNLAVVGAGRVQVGESLIDYKRTRVYAVSWIWRDRSANLLVVDLPSEVGVHRDPLLREINILIERGQPDLVVGDFNAPRRSWALCELPAGYRHGYDSAGSGCGYTWPVPVPMYALDHCIHSTRIIPARYALNTSIYSDHRLQVFDFSWSP